jgi:hypothetical protein
MCRPSRVGSANKAANSRGGMASASSTILGAGMVATRTGMASTLMHGASSAMVGGAGAVGRPHTPTMAASSASMHLMARTATAVGPGVAAGLSRVASRAFVGTGACREGGQAGLPRRAVHMRLFGLLAAAMRVCPCACSAWQRGRGGSGGVGCGGVALCARQARQQMHHGRSRGVT